jgi:cardiolipin synthase (CMP-forming)
VILSWLLDRAMTVHPHIVSKINTALQILLVGLVLAERGLALGWTGLVVPMIWLTGAVTALSAVIYLISWLRHMARYDIDDRRRRAGSEAGQTH